MNVVRWLGYWLLSVLVVVGCALGKLPPQISSESLLQETVPMDSALMAGQELSTLAQPGPWRDVTHLIAYGDRLWFTNSIAGTNHNVADIYSYDPETQVTRYEQHLFSQDAGTPMVSEGLLYWPFEDPRFSADLGEYMVTNGQQWQWRVLPAGEAFHVHTMVAHEGTLFAGTGAWAGGLQRSQDRGQTWEVIYSHPTPAQQVSRLTQLAFLKGQLYGGVTALHDQTVKLLHWEMDTFSPVEDWPQGKQVMELTPYQDWLYGINQNLDDSFTLWRTNGQRSEPVAALANYRIRALASDDEALWAISTDQTGNFLLHSCNGIDWAVAYQFDAVLPLDIAIFQGRIYVGGRNDQNQGILMGATLPTQLPTANDSEISVLVSLLSVPHPLSPEALAQAIQQLDPVLSVPATYSGGDTQNTLAQALLPLALSQTEAVGEVLSQQLQSSFPQVTATLFENLVKEPAADVARWYLLWAMGLNGQGYVPVSLLSEPWSTPGNDREKYWQSVPAAAWTIAQIGQSDRETLSALIKRLSESEDPLWLTGDVVGALSRLTGKRFGYDVAAWQTWWQNQRDRQFSSSRQVSTYENPSIRFGCSYDWAGWWPWSVAQEQHLFEENGANVELQWFDDYYEALDALATGNLDANCQVLNDTVEMVDQAVNGEVIILVTDNSDGNDKIIATDDIETIHDLVGHRVGVEKGKLTDFLLTLALEKAAIDRSAINVKYLNTAIGAIAFVAGQLEAIVAWQPDWITALSRPGSRELLSSKDLPGAIPQVVAVSQKLLEEQKHEVQALVNTWFDTLEFIHNAPDLSKEIMLKRSALSETNYQRFIQGVHLFSVRENIAAFSSGETLEHLAFTAQKASEFLINAGEISQSPNLTALFNDEFVKRYESQKY